ncbi:hypothetical protein [Candidatus Oscillochloris fontis]|uniref:hypothetical protein n=1 Tax=Candidatus Oscillochloris fontis TaxID=2496868 RepID=UPI00101B9222|nr:hypothetical protein [Candidatus Oscillochloris fontis]
MPPIRSTHHTHHLLPPGVERWHGQAADSAGDSTWPVALRAMLLFTGAVLPDDATLARTSNDDLNMLRVSLNMLGNNDHSNMA